MHKRLTPLPCNKHLGSWETPSPFKGRIYKKNKEEQEKEKPDLMFRQKGRKHACRKAVSVCKNSKESRGFK